MARSERRKLVAELRAAEPGLSLRQMARRLGLSRDTVRRDLDDINQQAALSATPVAEPAPPVAGYATADAGGADPVTHTAPQVNGGSADGAADSAPPAEASAPAVAQRAPLVQRLTGPLALPDEVDLRQWPAVRRDLATLAQTGVPVEKLVHDAIVTMAHHYRKALAAKVIERGQSFTVHDMTLRPLPVAPRARQAD
ncbi:helix-turn-helix domain-containing protein [Streptomyces sp. NPDC060006]|uniref:helix-turn-helix domain-containing protein n=1 Tax=unclassified Streptomyces TaxID=2593676 RepID=UPI0036964D5B